MAGDPVHIILRAKGGIACTCSSNKREFSIAPQRILRATTKMEDTRRRTGLSVQWMIAHTCDVKSR
jgi:hypothetical protein